MKYNVKIRKNEMKVPFKTHLIDAPNATKAIVEAIERTMLENDEPIICSAVVPFEDYDFTIEEVIQ